MTLGDLLAQLGEHLYKLWPFRIIDPWETGFRTTLGRAGKVLPPGLKWVWPFLQELIIESSTRDIDQTPSIIVQTSDNKTYAIVLTAEYRITDVRKLYMEIQDHDSTVMNRIAASIGTCATSIASRNLIRDLTSDVLDDCIEDLKNFGVELLSCEIVSLHPVRAFRLITDS